jgi:amino-acid N-acetyltransferase
MTTVIRSAVRDDWGDIERLIAQEALPTGDLSAAVCSYFKVYAEGSRIIGVIGLEPLADQCAMLRSLVVTPSARGQGIGHMLFECVEAQARLQRLTEIFLLTTSADGFFSQLGYERHNRESIPECVKVHEQFRSLCPTSAILMSKRVPT